MKTICYFFVLYFGLVSTLNSQVPDTLWTQTYGGSDREIAGDIQQTADGGYIITGSTMSFGAGQYDVYLIKTDVSGLEQWSRTFGGNEYEMGRSVQITADGGYIIAGYTDSFGAGGWDVYLIKTDNTGIELWSKTYGDIYGDEALSVRQTTDGGYIIAGRTWNFGAGGADFYLIKTDASGTEQWSQTYGGPNNDKCNSVELTSDGGYILAGYTYSDEGYPDFYLIKTDSSGTEEWSKSFGHYYYNIGKVARQTSDGGYIFVGTSSDFYTGILDVQLNKYDSMGEEQWSEIYGGSSSGEGGEDVQQTIDGGYIIVGNRLSGNNREAYLIKTDGSGTEQWSQIYGGNYEEYGKSIQHTLDGGYIILGGTESFSAGYFDVWLIKTDAELTGIWQENSNIVPPNHSLQQNYPNPFNTSTTIPYLIPEASNVELSIFNSKGQKIKSLLNDFVSAGEFSIVWNGTNDNNKSVGPGLYLYKLTINGKSVAVKRCLFLK